MFYTYLYIDPRTRLPFYVGKGQGKRIYDLGSHNKFVQGRIRILNEMGLHHLIEIAYVDSESDAFWFEQDLIAIFGRRDLDQGPLLNHTNGGEGTSGPKSEEHKRKIGMGHKGLPKPQTAKMNQRLDIREKRRIQMMGNQFGKGHHSCLGKTWTLSEESKQKHSLALKGKPKSPEHKEKLRIAALRRYHGSLDR